MLTNPKYVGTLLWGRTSQKLGGPVRRSPESDWIVVEKAFDPIIDGRTFSRVQRLLKRYCGRRIADEDLIRAVKQVYKRHGKVTEKLMGAKNGTFSLCAIYRRFGSTKRIYDRIGFKYPARTFSHGQETVRVRDQIVQRILEASAGLLSRFRLPHAGNRSNLTLEGRIPVYVYVAPHMSSKSGRPRWAVRPNRRENDGPVLLCVMRTGNRECQSLFLLPPRSLKGSRYEFGLDDVLLRHGIRLKSMSAVCPAVRGIMVQGPYGADPFVLPPLPNRRP
jgi:hypothetical protein